MLAMPRPKRNAKQPSAIPRNSAPKSLEYLSASSDEAIDSFYLSRLNLAANLRKEMHDVLDELVEARAQAIAAERLLQPRDLESDLESAPEVVEARVLDALPGPIRMADVAGVPAKRIAGRSLSLKCARSRAINSASHVITRNLAPGIAAGVVAASGSTSPAEPSRAVNRPFIAHPRRRRGSLLLSP